MGTGNDKTLNIVNVSANGDIGNLTEIYNLVSFRVYNVCTFL